MYSLTYIIINDKKLYIEILMQSQIAHKAGLPDIISDNLEL